MQACGGVGSRVQLIPRAATKWSRSEDQDRSARVVRVAARSAAERTLRPWTNPARRSVDVLRIRKLGAEGDYNHFRTTRKWNTPDRAISLMTLEALDSLRVDGFGVEAGDLGENVTLDAPEALLKPGVCLYATNSSSRKRTNAEEEDCGSPLILEITEGITPCRNLDYVPGLASLPERVRRRFPKACRGRRGWYARVIEEGDLCADDVLMLHAPAYEENRQDYMQDKRERQRRWRAVPSTWHR